MFLCHPQICFNSQMKRDVNMSISNLKHQTEEEKNLHVSELLTYLHSCDFFSHKALNEDLSPFCIDSSNSDERPTKLSSVTKLCTKTLNKETWRR